MRLNETINRFALVSGLEPEEVSKWTVLCCDASKEVERMVPRGVTLSEEDTIRLSRGAGIYAYYKYCMYAYVTKVKAFTAGNVSVTISQDEVEHAEKLWKAERESLCDILGEESGFCFRGVRV